MKRENKLNKEEHSERMNGCVWKKCEDSKYIKEMPGNVNINNDDNNIQKIIVTMKKVIIIIIMAIIILIIIWSEWYYKTIG